MDNSNAMPTPTDAASVRELVQQHKICWQVWPLRYTDPKEGVRAIGYRLELLGTHHEPQHTPDPGCDECVKVYSALERVARSILPKEERDSVCRVGIFDHALRFSPRRGFRKDVELAITIQHRTGLTDPVDECEIRCVREMEERLRMLGVHQNEW